MGGKLTSALSQETRNLLKDNSDFFEAITKQGKDTGKAIKGRDAEAHTEVEVQSDGNVAVTFVFPVDDNANASDGRIYLRDTFVFDPSQKKLNSYKRDFQYNGRGDNKEDWKKWLAGYKASALPDDQKLQAFALTVARSFARPFSAKHLELFTKHKPTQFQGLLDAAAENGLALRIRGAKSHYAVIYRGLTTDVVFSYLVEDASGKKNGNLFVQDKFSFNGNTGEMVGFDRAVNVGEDGGDADYWKEKAAALSAVAKPTSDQAKTFIKDFGPTLLTEIPEPAQTKAQSDAPPPAYGDYSEALFKRTMNSVVRTNKAVPMADLEPQFFAGMGKASEYFAPLQASLGKDFTLDLKDPPLEVSTVVEGSKTSVFYKYTFKPQGEEGLVDYTERWTFENGFPTKVDRRAQALSAPDGGTADRVAKQINADIKDGKYPPLADDKQQIDKRSSTFLEGTIPYAAPSLTYFGMPKVLEKPELGYDQRIVFGTIDNVLTSLTPVLNQSGVDPIFRTRVIRMLSGMVYGDLDTASAAMDELQKTEQAALQAATTPEEKQRHEDFLLLTTTVGVLSSGDLDKAQAMANQFHSPTLKKAFTTPLTPAFARRHSLEGLAIISKVAEDQTAIRLHDSKAWSYKGPKVDVDAEKKVLDGLMQKAYLQTTVSKSSDALTVLRELSAVAKDKKPEQYDEVEKQLALTADERALADRLMGDPLMKKISDAAQDDMKDVQAKAYLSIARDDLLDKGMPASAHWLAQLIVSDKLPKSRSAESLDILRTMAAEKIDAAYPALKTDTTQFQPPAELSALEPLLTKVAEQSVNDPTKPILTILKDMKDLQGDEAKLRDYLLKSPSLQKVEEAAKLKTVAERAKVYRSLFDPVLKADPNKPADPQLAKVKGIVDEQLGAIEKMSKDEAPGPEGVLLAQLLIQLDLANQMQQKMGDVKKVADAHDKDVKTAQSLFDKASQASIAKPEATAFELLSGLADADLNDDEKKMRTSLLGDAKLKKYIDLSSETSAEKRGEKYIAAIKDDSLQKDGFPQTKVWLASMLQSGKIPDQTGMFPALQQGQPKPPYQEFVEGTQTEVRKFLDLTEGRGDFGSKFEVGLKHFSKEVSKPTTLAAMTVAPFVGAGCEMYGLWRFRNWGIIGRGIAVGAGVAGEAAAFTYTSKALDSYFYSSDGVWDNHKKDLYSNILLFGAMRGAHYTSGALTEKFLATGRFGKWAGGYVAGEEAATGLIKTPAGKIEAVAKATGPGVPQLTVAGKRVGGLLDNAGALTAMYGAGKANYKLGWSKQDATLADTFLMYVQAMAGFKLADGITNGKLGLGLATTKMRIENFKNGGAPAPTVSKPIPADMLRLFGDNVHDLTLVKAEGGDKLAVTVDGGASKGAVDSFLLGDGKGLRFSFDKDGKLTLHNEQKLDSESKAEGGKKRKKVKKTDPKADEKKADDKKADDAKDEKKADDKKDEEKKADDKKVDEKKADDKSAEEKKDESKPADAEKKADDAKDDAKKDEEKKDDTAKPADGTPDGEPAAPEAPKAAGKKLPQILVNGKPVKRGEAVTLGHGDVITVDGKEVTVETPSKLVKKLSSAPREQQLSLARKIAKAKDPGALFNMLKDSPYQGAVEILEAVADVFSGKEPLESLPTELGLRGKIESLLKDQVADLKKAGITVSPDTQLKAGILDARLSPLEAEFHTLKAMEALKLQIAMARNLPELIEILGKSSFEKIGGISPKEVLDWLGYEQLKAVLEQTLKNEAALREKIEIGEKRLKLEEGKKKKEAHIIAELKEKLADWKEAAEQSKLLQPLLQQAIDASKPAEGADPAETDLAKIVEKLPSDLGIRQKARDAVEQGKGDFAKTVSEKDQKSLIALVKRYLDVSMTDDFDAAQRSLRRELDTASPQARILLRRAKPEELDLLMKVYFGPAEGRELPASQAYQVATLFGKSKAKQAFGIHRGINQAGDNVQLVHGDLDALVKNTKDGGALLLRTHTESQDGQGLAFTKAELVDLAEQAKEVFKAVEQEPNGGHPYRNGAPGSEYRGQKSDTVVFYNAEENTTQTWVIHPQGISKITISLDEEGHLESYQIKYAVNPGAEGNRSLLIPEKMGDLVNGKGEPVKIEQVKADYNSLLKEFPFDVSGVTRVEKVFDGIAKVTDKIPSLPKLPKFGKGKPEAGKGPKDPKDPPAGGGASKTEPKPADESPKADGNKDTKTGEGEKSTESKGSEAKKTETLSKDEVELARLQKALENPDSLTEQGLEEVQAKEAALRKKVERAKQSASQGLLAFLGVKGNPVTAFFRGIGTFLSGLRAPAKPAAAKPKAPAVDPTVIKPAQNAPKTEGNRPTLPQGIVFPPARVAMGETETFAGPEDLSFSHQPNAVMGEFSGRTHEGGKTDENQDMVAFVYTPEGDLVLIDADGMGGHNNGKRAAEILGHAMVAEIGSGKGVVDAAHAANQKMMAEIYNPNNKYSGGAGVVAVKINRPAAPGAPSTLEAFWGSDVQFVLYRKAPDGHANWIYSTLTDNMARMAVDYAKKFGPKGEGRDLAINSAFGANQVGNVVGRPDFKPHSTEEGEVFDPVAGFKSAAGLEKIALEDGDVGIGGSDGLWKNIPDRNLAYEWTKDAKSASEKAKILEAKILPRMKIVKEAEAKFENKEIPESDRMPFQLEGKDLFIDNAGNVYDQAKDGNLVDHYDADNLSIFVYVHNPGAKPEVAKVEVKVEPDKGADDGLKEPSQTGVSDPDRTVITKLPDALKVPPAPTKVDPPPGDQGNP